MDYAINLKLARKWAGITQKELAERAGVATITIHQYESGKRTPTIKNWFAIADALHLSLDELNNADLLPTRPFDPDDILVEAEQDKKELEGLLLNSFSKLNANGQHEAVKRVEELTEIKRYRAETSPLATPEGKVPPRPNPLQNRLKTPDRGR